VLEFTDTCRAGQGYLEACIATNASCFQGMLSLMPGAVRIAGLYNMGNPVVPPLWNELQTAARNLGLTPQLLDIRKVEDIAPAFADATSKHVDALVPPSTSTKFFAALVPPVFR
jgi:ABC-type uncharacterized transport system substrate-binding protein